MQTLSMTGEAFNEFIQLFAAIPQTQQQLRDNIITVRSPTQDKGVGPSLLSCIKYVFPFQRAKIRIAKSQILSIGSAVVGGGGVSLITMPGFIFYIFPYRELTNDPVKKKVKYLDNFNGRIYHFSQIHTVFHSNLSFLTCSGFREAVLSPPPFPLKKMNQKRIRKY